jgi:hypothetical protein
MKHDVLVVGHADADGHLIAEQVRRNLAQVSSFDVRVVVDPTRTRDHKAWLHLDSIEEIESADYVFFVDMMFAPSTYIEEANALTDFVQERPYKRFFLIDHHPLPLRRLETADNLRVIYRPDVSDCAIGQRSGMMVVAAICENQGDEVADVKSPVHDTLARGIRRAAARGGPLPGEKLLALLKADCWDGLWALGNDDPQYHYLPRGLRPAGRPLSEALTELDELADSLLAYPDSAPETAKHSHDWRNAMAYDVDVGQEQLTYDSGLRTIQSNVPPSPKDLGVIVTLLEVAALSLTTEAGATFTLDQLIREAREIGGVALDDRDVRIVLKKSRFLENLGGGLMRLR